MKGKNKMSCTPIIGQEVVTPKGLGRVVSFTIDIVTVEHYMTKIITWFDRKNVKLVKIIYQED